MEVRPIDGEELLGIERLRDTDVVRQSKTASWLLDQVLHDIQAMPTITPPNEPLTSDELREMDGEPVYAVSCKKHHCGAYGCAHQTKKNAVAYWNTRAPILSSREMEMLDAKD